MGSEPYVLLRPTDGSLGNAQIKFDGTDYTIVSNSSSAKLKLATNSTDRLTILHTGEVGIVVRQNDTRRLKPEIILVLDDDKQRRPYLELLDLSASGLLETDTRWIARELTPNSYGVNNEEFFI